MSEFQIERGIPLPGERKRRHRYPLWDMEVGESFYVPQDRDTIDETRKRMYSVIRYAQKATGRRFEYRIFTEGIRVWRTE